MSNKDKEFEEWMDTLDVVPGARSAPTKNQEHKRKKDAQKVATRANELAVFEEAMAQLEAVPDKDGVAATVRPSGPIERVKPSYKESQGVQATLDLHGCALDLHWTCMDLQWICIGFALEL